MLNSNLIKDCTVFAPSRVEDFNCYKKVSFLSSQFWKSAVKTVSCQNFPSVGKSGLTAGCLLIHSCLVDSWSYNWSIKKRILCTGQQRPKNLGGRVVLPSGNFLPVWKVFACNPWNYNWEFPDPLENFQIVWIFSRLSLMFSNSLESFQIGWIFSGWSGKFLDSLEMINAHFFCRKYN